MGEREVLAAMLDVEPGLAAARPGLILITDKGQLDLEAHGGRTFEDVATRVAQRILAMSTAIWYNNQDRATPHQVANRLRPLKIH
jgi:hypothetical protein